MIILSFKSAVKKLRVPAIASVALLVAGCGAGQIAEVQPQPLEPVPLSTNQITVVQNTVKFSLQDPGAAQFGTIKGGKDQGGKVVVCGLVNAKNNFGGFTGMTFTGEIDSGGSFKVAAMGDVADVSLAIQQVCVKQGLAIQTVAFAIQ
jgi:hypothetical protein